MTEIREMIKRFSKVDRDDVDILSKNGNGILHNVGTIEEEYVGGKKVIVVSKGEKIVYQF